MLQRGACRGTNRTTQFASTRPPRQPIRSTNSVGFDLHSAARPLAFLGGQPQLDGMFLCPTDRSEAQRQEHRLARPRPISSPNSCSLLISTYPQRAPKGIPTFHQGCGAPYKHTHTDPQPGAPPRSGSGVHNCDCHVYIQANISTSITARGDAAG